MIEMIRLLFLLYAGQITFLSIIERKYPAKTYSYKLIAETHDFVESIFRHTYRQTGEHYIRHLESTAIICLVWLEMLGLDDPNVLVAALLHDLLEDRRDWTYKRLRRKFGKDIAALVQWVSKRDLAYFNGDEVRQEEAFKAQLNRAPFRPILIKLADQSHNLLTLWGKTVGKQRLKILLARDFYTRLAQKHNTLVKEIKVSIFYATALQRVKGITGIFLLPRLR